MSTPVTMPQLGESVVEGTVGKWMVSEGEAVSKDQPLVEILTDKAGSEVPAPVAGVVTKLFVGEDDVIAVGAVLCEIAEGATAAATPSAPKTMPSPEANSATPNAEAVAASPSVRRMAREQGLDLRNVTGSGPGGQLTRSDLSSPAKQTQPVSAPQPATPPRATPAATTARKSAFRVPPYVPAAGDEVVAFSRRRRIIADHMVYSKQTSPDVVTFAECDLHATAKLRNANKGRYKAEGVGLTYLAFATMATARALREFPDLNARVLDDAYVKLGAINVGIAVDTPQGLVVPVIKNADSLSLRGIAKAITDLATRGRDGNLTPDDLGNKTFTVSNPGRKGNLVGGAIISQPNVGILRLGTIKKRVVVVEHDGEDLMAIHPVMHMALTYDHRVVDGVHANGFLYRIAELLESADFDV